MKVSVIIPVYNAAQYVSYAVYSALRLNETEEILLIEDGSKDNSLDICKDLERKYDRVKLYTHGKGINKGAGASRNLGLTNASNEVVSFLDADDFYTEHRFKKDIELLQEKEIDGVYGATGIRFENEEVRNRWIEELGFDNITTTINHPIPPDDLFRNLLFHTNGHFTTNAITFKKKLLDKTGLFDTHLILHEDTALWLKMAATGNLVAGEIKQPVAIRRVHSENRISSEPINDFTNQRLLYNTLLEWAKSHSNSQNIVKLIKYRIWKNEFYIYDYRIHQSRKTIHRRDRISAYERTAFFMIQCMKYPQYLFTPYTIKFIKELFVL